MTKNNNRDLTLGSQADMRFFEYFSDNPVIHWESGILLIKDLKHRFIASNITFSQYSGYDPKSIIGLSDEDMPWAQNKDIYIGHEKDIISGLEYSVIEPLNGMIKSNLHTTKSVIYSKKGRPSGTIATAIVFNGEIEYGNLSGTAIQMKVSSYPGYLLTNCECKVLYLLLKGFSRRKISELAKISTSAYDFHLKNIKKKFETENVDDLISICYKNGFHEIVPYMPDL